MSQELARSLLALQKGEITFTAFHRRTHKEWRRMAYALHERFELPPGVTPDDVEQEMLLAAFRAIPRWDPKKAALEAFVVWTAHAKAKRWLHRQRLGNPGKSGKGASRHAIGASQIVREDGLSILDEASIGAPESEQEIQVKRILEKIPLVAETEAGRKALAWYVESGADEEDAAMRLWANGLLFRVRSPEHARKIVKSEVRRLREAVLSEN